MLGVHPAPGFIITEFLNWIIELLLKLSRFTVASGSKHQGCSRLCDEPWDIPVPSMPWEDEDRQCQRAGDRIWLRKPTAIQERRRREFPTVQCLAALPEPHGREGQWKKWEMEKKLDWTLLKIWGKKKGEKKVLRQLSVSLNFRLWKEVGKILRN